MSPLPNQTYPGYPGQCTGDTDEDGNCPWHPDGCLSGVRAQWANYPDPEAAMARMEKYGSTLNESNIKVLIERIADYPEIIAAVLALPSVTARWYSPKERRPEPNVVVETLDYHGEPKDLFYQDGLWWTLDKQFNVKGGDGYLLVDPILWRPKP